jgi:hypothetical protein
MENKCYYSNAFFYLGVDKRTVYKWIWIDEADRCGSGYGRVLLVIYEHDNEYLSFIKYAEFLE